MRRLPFAISLIAITLSSAAARPFGQVGLAIKTGESAGGFGAQAAYNLDAHWQLAAGVGGAGIPWFLELGNERTDSYFLMGKYYFKHMFLGLGYSLKRARLDKAYGPIVVTNKADAHGIPFTLGYEFGHRKGFFLSTSIGFLQMIKGGDRKIRVNDPDPDPTTRGSEVSMQTASSGPSVGITLGYYFDTDR